MRYPARLGAAAGGVVVVLSAGPAAAASPVLAAGAPKSWLVILAAIAAGLGAFLLLVILFGGGKTKRDVGVAGRLGSYGQPQEKSAGLFVMLGSPVVWAHTANLRRSRQGFSGASDS